MENNTPDNPFVFGSGLTPLDDTVICRAFGEKMSMVVIIDNSPSMKAFSLFANQIARNVCDESSVCYYCNNLISEDYTDANRKLLIERSELVSKRLPAVLLISDLGAVKGEYSSYRIAKTKAMVQQLSAVADKVVCINPMPKERMVNTSAGYMPFLTIFEVTEQGISLLSNYVKF